MSAVQIYNNPLIGFKTESFIVLALIAWIYLLHAHYRVKKIEYRYYDQRAKRRRFLRNADGSILHWDLKHCIGVPVCPLDKNTINNLIFLIGLRNQLSTKRLLAWTHIYLLDTKHAL